MDRLYRFSPIKSEAALRDVITYVANQTAKLCHQLIGERYPITSLTVFSHYPDEYERLKSVVLSLGRMKTEQNGPYVKLKKPITVSPDTLRFLRVRKPDPYRMHVGCNDFDVPNYEAFKKTFLDKKAGLRLIERPKYEMIELYDPDYDVLAYVVSTPLL